jgi:hypothetical protein
MEFDGVWWLPDKQDHRVKGTLKIYDNHSSLLELRDILTKDEIEKIPIIHGVIFEGSKEVTLLECLQSDEKEDVLVEYCATQKNQKISPLVTIIGKHIKVPLSKLKIKKMMVRIPELDFWFPRNICSDLIKFEGKTIKITTDEKQIFCDELDDFVFKIIYSIGYSINQKGASYTLKDVKVEPYIVLEFKEAKNLKDCYDLLHKLIGLFSLAISDRVHISEILCSDDSAEFFNVYIQTEYCRISIEPKFIPPDRILFDFNQFKNHNCIRNWLSMYERLELLCEYYSSTITNENLSIEYKFLNLVIALEFYHRYSERFEQHKIDPNKWIMIKIIIKERILEMLKSKSKITDEEIKHINRKIEFVHEKSLRRRLLEIIRDDLEIHELLFRNSNERDKFINDVIKIRNTLAHGLSDEAFNYNYEMLLTLTNKLKIIVECAILHELGFNEEEIKNIAVRRLKELAKWKLIALW